MMSCNYINEIYVDNYSLYVGIRSIKWSKQGDPVSFTINNEPFYCKGVNKHEDFSVN